MSPKIALISANMNKGQSKPGTEYGASQIKQESLFETLTHLEWNPHEFGEVNEKEPNESVEYLHNKNIAHVAQTTRELSDLVEKAINQNSVPVVLGGDHSLAIGSVHGSLKALSSQIGLIWVDAHADINTPLTSGSGHLHGQPVSFIAHELVDIMPKLKGFDWITNKISLKNIVYIGLRDVDPAENLIIKKFKIKAFSMSDVQRLGISRVMDETLEYLSPNNQLMPLHVSVDIDSLDPWFAPSTGTPVLGGLTLPELMYIGNRISETNKLRTLDLVEVNPLIKETNADVNRTVFSAIRTIQSFFGYTTIGTAPSSFTLPTP